MEKMSLKKFKEFCMENDYNILEEWDWKRFDVKCSTCGSENIQIGHRTKKMGYGSTLTGAWTRENAGLLVKCLDCGKAMTILLD